MRLRNSCTGSSAVQAPDAEHTPGMSHIFADMLSRVDAPVTNKGMGGVLAPDVHLTMLHSKRVTVPTRGTHWYKA